MEYRITVPVEDIREEIYELAKEHIDLIIASGYDPKMLCDCLIDMFNIGYRVGVEDHKLAMLYLVENANILDD
jgi:hypothetical protein